MQDPTTFGTFSELVNQTVNQIDLLRTLTKVKLKDYNRTSDTAEKEMLTREVQQIYLHIVNLNDVLVS